MYQCDCCGMLKDDLPVEHIAHTETDPTSYEIVLSVDCGCGGCFCEVTACDGCGDVYEQGELLDGYCSACCSKFETTDTMLKYVNSALDRQKDFYIGAQFDFWIDDAVNAPGELLKLCKKNFDDWLKMPWADSWWKEKQANEIRLLLLSFISADKNHFYEWCIESKVKP